MNTAGHNNPPSILEFCAETTADLGRWLEEHPVIQTEDDAREAKLLIDRAVSTIADAEAERDKQVRPLNEQVKAINERYKTPRETLRRVADLLKERIAAFIKAEKERREQEAENRRREAEEAEARARLAEEREREAKEAASVGEVVDVGRAVAEADDAFRGYESSVREAARAEREAERVKVGGGYRRAISLRTKEVLVLHNWQKAIDEMGLSEALIESILKEARAFRKATGHLPEGVTATTEEII
jgi:hypothetical protein